MEVGKFEGVQEATAEIAAGAYMLEAMRQMVTKGLDQGKAPSVVTSMAKYHATEMMRRLLTMVWTWWADARFSWGHATFWHCLTKVSQSVSPSKAPTFSRAR